MPPDMAINMRRTKIKAEEAALLAGEVTKPSWESRNEGIHERVSFEDAIWGFDLAGGAYYQTPLRVVGVKPDSRAEKAGIRPGDRLKRINDIDTSTLTIQEAHKIIIDSGIHLKIAVTAPEDEEDAYYCYEDPLEQGYDSEEERRKEEEKERKRHIHAKVSSYWSLQWPWVSKRRVIYRESNCFMVPSKFEDKHKDRFSPQPMIRIPDDIVLDSIKSKDQKKMPEENSVSSAISDNLSSNTNSSPIPNGNNATVNSVDNLPTMNGKIDEIPEIHEEKPEEEVFLNEELTEEISQSDETLSKEISQNDIDESNVESEPLESNIEELGTNEEISDASAEVSQEEEVNNEVFETAESLSKEEERILESILSDSEEQMNSQSDDR